MRSDWFPAILKYRHKGGAQHHRSPPPEWKLCFLYLNFKIHELLNTDKSTKITRGKKEEAECAWRGSDATTHLHFRSLSQLSLSHTPTPWSPVQDQHCPSAAEQTTKTEGGTDRQTDSRALRGLMPSLLQEIRHLHRFVKVGNKRGKYKRDTGEGAAAAS